MAQLRKVQGSDYQLGQAISTNGRVVICKGAKQTGVCKIIPIGKRSIKELIDECDQLKIKLSMPGTYFPTYYWEDKGSLYLVYDRFKQSLEEVIEEQKRKGQYLTMSQMKNFVGEFTSVLGKIHRKKTTVDATSTTAHCRIKPSNLFLAISETGEEEYIFTDFQQFSNDNLEDYMAPEQYQTNIKNSSQRFSSGILSLQEQVGGDPQKVDIWQLGITFMQLATLKNCHDLLIFRDNNTSNSVQVIEMKEICRKLYGRYFVEIIEQMLQKNVGQRKKMQELEQYIESFLGDQDIDHEQMQLIPDVEAIMRAVSNRIQQKQLSFSQFFGKYEMQPMNCRVKTMNFYDGLEDLGLKLSMKEKSVLEQKYQNQGEIDLSQFIQKQRSMIKLGNLNHDDEHSLKEMQREMQEYLQENKQDLMEIMKSKDKTQSGLMNLQEFLSILMEVNLGLRPEDEQLVKKKYDPDNKGLIYYINFCEDIQQYGTIVQQQGLPEIKQIMYKNLRDKHTTYIQFFRMYDQKQAGYLTYESINLFLNECQLHPSPQIIKALMNQLDPDNKREILFTNFRNFFQDLNEEEMRKILNMISESLSEMQLTFGQMVRANTKSANIITQQQLYNGLRQSNIDIKRPDFTYFLSYYQAKEEIEYPRFIEAIQESAKRLKVQNLNAFFDQQQYQQQQLVSAFDDPNNMQTINRSITFNVQQFESQKNLLSEIHRQLDLRQKTPIQYFKSPLSRMLKTDYKKKLREIDISPNDYLEEQEDLLFNVAVPNDRTQIDTDLLIEAILYYKAKFSEKTKFSMHQVVAYFNKLEKAMVKSKFTIEEFNDLDSMGDGTLRKKQFERVLNEELGLQLNDISYREFYQYIQQGETSISLIKLRNGIQYERLAEKLLYDLNMEMAYDSVKPEQIFRKYDANRNGKLELKEFQEFIHELSPQADNKVVEILFYKMDDDGDLVINLPEFKKRIIAQVQLQPNQQTQKYKYKPTVESSIKKVNANIIQNVLHLREIMRDRTLGMEIFDKQKRGKILINAFQDVIVNEFNIDYSELKQLVAYIQSDSPQFLITDKLQALFDDCDEAEQLLFQLNSNINNGKVALAQLFYNYDQNGNDSLEQAEFSILIKDIDVTARPKAIQTLFFLLDSNQDNTISIQEFKSKIAQKEKPRLLPQNQQAKLQLQDEIIRFIKSSSNFAQALEDQDNDFTNKLTPDQIVRVMKSIYGPTISIPEMKAFSDELGASQGNLINYKVLISKARNYASKTPTSRMDLILTKLKEDLEFKGVSISEVAKSLDFNNKGRIKFAGLKVSLLDKKISLKEDEWDLVLSIVEMDAQSTIDYIALEELIQIGFQKFKDQKKVLVVNTNQEIDKIVALVSDFMETNICTLLYVFRRTDKNFDSFLSQEEFIDLLQKTVGYKAPLNIEQQLFKIFDMDLDGKINYVEFEYQVYKRCEVNSKQIQDLKLLLLNGRNPQIENHVSDLFNIIAQGQLFFEFKQFHQYVIQFKKFRILELDQYFRHFDQQMLEKVELFTFMNLMYTGYKQTPDNQQQDYNQQSVFQSQQQQFPNNNQQYQTTQQPYPNNQQYISQQSYPQQQQYTGMTLQPNLDNNQYSNNEYQQQQQQQNNQYQNTLQSQIIQQNPNNNQYYPENQSFIDHSALIPNIGAIFQQQQQLLLQQQQSQQQLRQDAQPNQQYPQQQTPQYPQQQTPQYPQQQTSQYPQQQTSQYPQQQNQYPQQQTPQYPQQQNQQPQQQQNLQQPYKQEYINKSQLPNLMDTGIPLDFDREFYEQKLKKQCINFNVDLFDLLCQFDKSALPDLKLTAIPDLEQVFIFLEIQIPTKHATQFYFYYSHQSEQMSISELYVAQTNPGKLMAKALNFTMLKHKDYTIDKLWGLIGKQSPAWSLPQFQTINQNLRLNLTPGEVKEAFQFWDLQNQGKVTYQNYVDILQTNLIAKPSKQKNQQNNNTQILDDLLLQLSEIVLSKQCFNLYEDADKKKYNEIPIADFEKITRKLMIDITAQEIQIVRQYLSKDGQINLSDLAKALKVDRQKGGKFDQEDEKKQHGIANSSQRKSMILPDQQQKFKRLVPIINDFLKKKQKTYEDLGMFLFPPGQNSVLDKLGFVKKFMEIGTTLTKVQCDELYDYLDANQSGQISLNEFRLVFQIKSGQSETVKKQVDNIVMGKDIEEEIKELFDQIDENKNQSLDQRELQKALCSVGLNPSVEELQQYFANFDKDNNGSISYQEFTVIVKDILRKELLSADDLLEELRREFRQVCNPVTRMLSKEQVSQVFSNMGVNLKNAELDDLFQEIDEDKSGSVDIDEFIYFIQKNQSGMSAKASAAIMNIKGTRRISLHDLKEIFLSLPNNFIISFVRNQNKKLLNMPSSPLKPQLDGCGFFYQGLNYVEASTFNIKQSILDKKTALNNLNAEIRLLEATGIPIPDENDVPRNSFLKREIGIILMDKARNRFEGNTMYLPAGWTAEYEDRWTFNLPPLEESILLRWGNFDEKLDNMVEIVFEFITYSVNKNRMVQISCAYGSLPVNQLKPGKIYIELRGGAPLKEITIDKKDIRANRTGWRSVVKAFSSNIKSQLLIEVYKMPPTQIQKILALPNRCVLNKWALSLWAAFREYFAYRTMMKGEIELNLSSDIRIKSFLNCVDCPDTQRSIAQLWNEFIEPKEKDHQFLLKAMQTIADSLYLMFRNSDFKFSQGDPTNRVDHDNLLYKKRLQLLNDCIQDIKVNLGLIANQNKKSVVIATLEPLNVEEMMDLDNEQDIAAMDKFLNRKKAKPSS